MKKFKILFLLIAFNYLLPTFLFAQMEWICATDSAAWSARLWYTSVVFGNKVWVLGGFVGDDVWYSTNCVNWTLATASAGWLPRGGHTSAVFNDRIWVLGGGDYRGNHLNDVWNSTDGVNWVQATDSAEWSGRFGHTSVVFDNKMWVLGGESQGHPFGSNDVWNSIDGVNWICATDSVDWSGRMEQASVVFDNKIWVLGGCTQPLNGKNDVWFSTDGVNWTQATDSAEWHRRYGLTAFSFDDKIWILGGVDVDFYNDVWFSTGLGIEEERTTLNAKRLMPEIYPNPAKSFLNIRLSPTANRQELKIFDVSGKVVREIATPASRFASQSIGTRSALRNDGMREIKISLKGINPGIYFLRLGKETKKFTVVK
jgi:hypothetical protein